VLKKGGLLAKSADAREGTLKFAHQPRRAQTGIKKNKVGKIFKFLGTAEAAEHYRLGYESPQRGENGVEMQKGELTVGSPNCTPGRGGGRGLRWALAEGHKNALILCLSLACLS